MSVTFLSKQPYLQVAKCLLYPVPEYCDEDTYYSETGETGEPGEPVHIERQIVGMGFDSEVKGCYIFQEGEKHNKLTLTNPDEIERMRAFIECRDYIIEL